MIVSILLIDGSLTKSGSMKKKTGMSTVSPALSRCSSKQKHCILLKYGATWAGVTLYVATPIMSSVLLFVAVKNARAVSPGRTRTSRCWEVNFQGMTSETDPLKVILRRREEVTGCSRTEGSSAEEWIEALIGWPPQPVCWHIWSQLSKDWRRSYRGHSANHFVHWNRAIW